MDALRSTVDYLYLAFADAAPPQHIEGCPCCSDDKRIPDLLKTPLRNIPPEMLAPYAASALLTVGDVSDYLYFLPRIIEFSACEPSWWPDLEVTARKLVMAGFESWPPTRRNALVQVLRTAFDEFLNAGEYWRINGWLCAVGTLGLDVRPYLKKVEVAPDAVLHYFEDNERCLKKGQLCNAFWELSNPAHDEIVRWFMSERIRRVPYEAYGYVMPRVSEQSHATEPATRPDSGENPSPPAG